MTEEKKKRRTIPHPPKVTHYRACDDSHSAAYVQWEVGSGVFYTGTDRPDVEQQVSTHIQNELDRIEKREQAKVKRVMARVKKNLAEAN